MSNPAGLSRDDVTRLIHAEYRAATHIPLQDAIAPFLIEPFVRMLAWPYAAERHEYPCWIVADLGSHAAGMTLAYSDFGHGQYGSRRGIVMADDQWFGRDDSWFTRLEDASSRPARGPHELPDEYEVR